MYFFICRNAWYELGQMGKEEAQTKYVNLVTELSPGWLARQEGCGRKGNEGGDSGGGLGPVFSRFQMEIAAER